MFALSQLVDIPLLFQRLDALPRELATARQELWAAKIEAREALAEHGRIRDEAGATRKEAWSRWLTFKDEEGIREDNLANLNDEMSALRAKVDLITALTRQVEIIEMPSLADQIWEKLRGDDFMGRSKHGTTKP